ncbi:unnamed protein product, partial [Chrysoparadoxa australica]
GLWGGVVSLHFFKQHLTEQLTSDCLVHLTTVNTRLKSYDGIDVCGLRLAKDIKRLCREAEESPDGPFTHISLIGHSFGGLVSRFCLGVLFIEGWFSKEGNPQPSYLITIATPHLGIR